ncbi:MAG TPA: TRAP transporter substrate-binding protein DctP [Desulfotignum sp.]|jgi:TRAP-type C4-dicarboxylate transport system substrate-binding protein|nr:TRAP transporter substrate-binding protein DctP [Desulfotignum sp.]
MRRLYKNLSMFVSVIFLGMAVVMIPQAAAADKVVKWKIQSGYPHGDLSFELLKGFADDVKQLSAGRFEIAVFADPEIVPLEQLFESTKMGVLDMLHAAGAFWGGIVPVGEIEFGIPYAYRIESETDFAKKAEKIRQFFFEDGFADLLREEYEKQGLVWLDMHTYGPVPFILSTKPIETMADLKGIKIRDEGLYTTWHNLLGARGTYISGSEAYLGLKTGVIDACQWDVSAISGLKLHEVAKYWIIGEENDHAIGHMLVNPGSYNKLSDELKQVLKTAAENYWHATVAGYQQEMEMAEQMAADGIIIKKFLDDAAIEAHWKAADVIWEEVAQRDEASKKAIEMLKAWDR